MRTHHKTLRDKIVRVEIRMLYNIQDTYEKNIQNYFQKTYKTTRKVFM